MASTVTASSNEAQVCQASAKSVFVAWELLRLVYNAALFLLVVLVANTLLGHDELSDPRFWRFLVKAAIGANLCFCAGPVVEGCLSYVGVPRRVSRPVLFVGGLLASTALAIACLSTWGWGDF